MRFVIGLLAAFVLLSTPLSLPGARASEPAVDIKLLSVASWLGQIEPVTTGDGRSLGGAALLGAYWQAQRDASTLAVGTGNSFGSSPPISNLFSDRPAKEAMNLIGFDVDTLGNDNFDHGIDYLQRAIDSASFDFVAANLEGLQDNLRGVES
jgi:2',3'-cyclic-nucleotide 2'-phosphodiesterase (5'-nucleotidase family)